MQVILTGDQEVPAVATAAKGTGKITIGADKSVSGTVTTTGIDGMMAHIHEGAPGQNGPPIIALEKALTIPLFFEIHRMSVFTPRSLDVDVVLDLMIHDIDIVLTLTGL